LISTESWFNKIAIRHSHGYHPLLNVQTWIRLPVGIVYSLIPVTAGAGIMVGGCVLDAAGEGKGSLCQLSLLRAGFVRAFEEVDCLVGAVLPVTAPSIGDPTVLINGKESTVVDAFTRLNAPQNMAGIPATSVPCGMARGLPVALQVIGASGQDATVLRLAAAFERDRT
jgi:Asp-tRNA(Asn)/Glu-tRNA(Gln) amidotransferase A subunit family amidase